MRKEKITPLYEHLGRDDELKGESNSISNPKQVLEDFAHRNGLPNPRHCTDDGILGTRFNRPVYGTFDNWQVFFRAEFQFVAAPVATVRFLPAGSPG